MKEQIKKIINSRVEQINTMLPAKIIKHDHKTNLCDAEITILQPDGTKYPVIQDIPIMQVDTAQINIKIPYDSNCHGVVAFCQADIDNYVNGISGLSASNRIHDLSDGIFLPVLQPTRLEMQEAEEWDGKSLQIIKNNSKITISDTNIEFKKNDISLNINDDGVEITSGNVIFKIVGDEIVIDGAVKLNGDINIEGTLSADDVEVDGKSLKNHKHSAGNLKDSKALPVTGITGANS